jgi:hypothetical protein
MPKKLKLDLQGFKVQSFVTSLDTNEKANVKGGLTVDTVCYPFCSEECTDTEVSCSCDTCLESCQGSCVTCNPKVYTCDPSC